MRKKPLEAYGKVKASRYVLVKNFTLQPEVGSKPLPTDTDAMLQELTATYLSENPDKHVG